MTKTASSTISLNGNAGSSAESLESIFQKLSPSDNQESDGRVSALDILRLLHKEEVIRSDQITSAWRKLSDHEATRMEQDHDKKIEIKSSSTTKADSTDNKQDNISQNENYRTRHIALRFYYDGARYSGLAENLGQQQDNSVEKQLFMALKKANLIQSRETSGFSRCGRTDRGVSSAGQVVALHLKSAIPLNATWDQEGDAPISNHEIPKNSLSPVFLWAFPRKSKRATNPQADQIAPKRKYREIKEYPYEKILNNFLPPDIRILGWCPVSEDFSARFSAQHRTYRYFFVKRQMNLDKMEEALQHFVGKHDFRNFCKLNVLEVSNFERVIHSAELVMLPENEVGYIQIVGQAFLWHQIRCIASVLFLIGQGLETPSIVLDLLDVQRYPGKPGYPLASEFPLVLHDCSFSHLQIGYSVNSLWTITCQLEEEWENLILAASRVRNCLESLKDCSVQKSDLVEFAKRRLDKRKKKLRTKNETVRQDLELQEVHTLSDDSILTWKASMAWFALQPDGLREINHIPLLQRSTGTTYEEKVAALKNSSKRLQKYNENIVKKRKTVDEDNEFYEHKLKQGGTGL